MGDLVSFGVQKLCELLSQEYEQFQGVEYQVTELKTDLNTLKSFLKDADAKKHSSEMVRNCVEVIKEIIFDAEDIIETFVIKEKFGKSSGIKNRIRRLACIIPEHREIALEIGGLSNRISKVIRDMKSFGVQHIITDGGSIVQPQHDRQREMRQTFSRDYESDLVGLEANVKKLVGLMVEEDNVQVVSITGMGGLGKTTLARQVFNHEMVKNKFDGFAWVCVSQEFTRKSVWQTILQNFSPKEDENKILQMTEATLQGELFRMLETSKSLIVLDDIWKEEDWDLIRPIFPPNKGWKVLLTSRNESVAVRGDTTHHKFKPECLNLQDSWTLFQRVANPRKHASELKVDEEMEKMGKQMIEHCGGLPLAVKVLGGLLATKYTLHDWKRISENIGSHLVGRTNFSDGNNSSFNYVLSLSYEELPSYLKHCFLYLAHFPEDYVIDVPNLSYYWVADGILKPQYYDGETIQDIGDSCMEELVRRNMVISKRPVATMRFRTCHLHDVMREICLFKAKEENFLQIVGTLNSQSHGTSRRLVQINPNRLDVETEINNPALRSLLVVMGDCWTLSSLSFTRLQLLRVLDLSGAAFERGKLPSDIGKLIHLKYLSLEYAKVSQLPSSLGNLKLLIYLNLWVSKEKAIFVPDVLMGMHELRFLILPDRMHATTKLELRNLINLETLIGFSTKNSSLADVHGMARLRNLEIILTEETSTEILSASTNGMRHLELLHIKGCGFDMKIENGLLINFVHLGVLYIDNCRLLDDQHFPSNLTIISLTECGLEEDPLSILEKLLHLKHVCLRSPSFCGRRMVCSSGGFPQLQTLELSDLSEWEEWIIEEGSMPLLHILYINGCEKLKELPDGLRFIYSLNHLSVYFMGAKWEGRLSEGGEDYYKVQHIPSVKLGRAKKR